VNETSADQQGLTDIGYGPSVKETSNPIPEPDAVDGQRIELWPEQNRVLLARTGIGAR
jgi:hypothetical protein